MGPAPDPSAGPPPLVSAPVFPPPSSRRAPVPTRACRWASGAGAAALVVAVAAHALNAAVGGGTAIGLVVVVAAAAAAVPLAERIGRSTPGLELAGLLRLSLGLKLLATIPRFETRVDSVVYHRVGATLADSFRRLDFTVDTGRSVPGTGTVRYATGLVEVATLEDEYATFVVFSLVGFVGVVLFLVAFVRGLPGVDPRRYAVLLLCWPSLLYWPSSIGKEALVLAGLGAAALGVASLLRGRRSGLAWTAAGLLGAGLVRPHVALIVVVAAVAALVVARGGSGHRPVLRGTVVAALLVGGALTAGAVEDLFDVDGLDPSGVTSALDLAESRSTQGGSGFAAARVDGPAEYPWGFVTVFFRPFPTEADSATMLLTAVEATVLALLLFTAAGRMVAALPRLRDEAYVVYAAGFVLVFAYLFSAIGNFGILARQRTTALPLVLVLVALPTAQERVRRRREGVAA